jgi:hypothetical protein
MTKINKHVSFEIESECHDSRAHQKAVLVKKHSVLSYPEPDQPASKLVPVYASSRIAMLFRALFLESKALLAEVGMGKQQLELQPLVLAVTANVSKSLEEEEHRNAALSDCFALLDSLDQIPVQDFAHYLVMQMNVMNSSSMSSAEIRTHAEQVYCLLLDLGTRIRRHRATLSLSDSTASSTTKISDLRHLFTMKYFPEDSIDELVMAERKCSAKQGTERVHRLDSRTTVLSVKGQTCRATSHSTRAVTNGTAVCGQRGQRTTCLRALDLELDEVMHSLFESIAETKQRLKTSPEADHRSTTHLKVSPRKSPRSLGSPRMNLDLLDNIGTNNSFVYPTLCHPPLSPRSPPPISAINALCSRSAY